MSLIEITLAIGFTLLTLAILLGLLRLATGPTVIDRILAFDIIVICSVAMIVLLSVQWRTPYFLELILIFSLLGFVGAVAFVFYLDKTYDTEAETAEWEQAPRSNPPSPSD